MLNFSVNECYVQFYRFTGKLLTELSTTLVSVELRAAIIEDNATARTALRGHVMSIANLSVSSYTSGVELKAALRKQNFELIIMDYHLGEGKTGVEWLQSLKEAGYIKPSTGVIFLTSDRSGQVIGRIMDLQPDILLIKPYTIASLSRQIKHYLHYRDFVKNVLQALDNKQLERAIGVIRSKIKEGIPPRLVSDIRKLYARLLYENGEIQRALSIYDDILSRSDKVLWAQWGKIKCQYSAGQWPECKEQLSSMVNSSLARDEAFEWLASLSFEQHSYEAVSYTHLTLPTIYSV